MPGAEDDGGGGGDFAGGQVQQAEDLPALEVQHDAAYAVLAQCAEALDAVVGALAEGELARVGGVEDRVLGAAPHHRGAQVQVCGGLVEAALLVVGGTLFGLSGHRRPGLGQHGAAADQVEDLVEVGVVVAELLQGALGLGVQGVEAALGQGDVQGPALSGRARGHDGGPSSEG